MLKHIFKNIIFVSHFKTQQQNKRRKIRIATHVLATKQFRVFLIFASDCANPSMETLSSRSTNAAKETVRIDSFFMVFVWVWTAPSKWGAVFFCPNVSFLHHYAEAKSEKNLCPV